MKLKFQVKAFKNQNPQIAIRCCFLFGYIFLISFLNVNRALGQQEITQSLYWLRYYNQLSINSKLTLHNEFDNRFFFGSNRQNQSIYHSRLHQNLTKNIDMALGITFSWQYPQDELSESKLIIPEWRPTQEINGSFSVSEKIKVQQRLRFDERFLHRNDGTILIDGYDFRFRSRYRLQAIYVLNNKGSIKKSTFKIADEVMLNSDKNSKCYFDQNRFWLAFEQDLSKQIALETQFVKIYQQRGLNSTQFLSRNIIRFTFIHRLKLKKNDFSVKTRKRID